MKSIIVTKYGSVFRPRSNLVGASKTGEQGETEGVIRHLLDRRDCQVVYFGQYRGDPFPGLIVVESDLSRVKEVDGDPLLLSDDAQKAGFDNDMENVLQVCKTQPAAMICVDGYAPTFSHVYNPTGATVQCAAINYCAPQLALLESLKIPRICISNDPRCVPRDQEMSFGWEWTRPQACLGQWDHRLPSRVIGGKRYDCRWVHARAESWAYLEQSDGLPHADRADVNVIAHAHLEDGMRCGSQKAWRQVLTDAPEGTRVWGKGWEAFAQPNQDSFDGGNVQFMGPCRPGDVSALLDATLCCPVVSHTPEFYTGKPWVLAARGVVPLLFGDGEHSHTYDPKGLLMDVQHNPCRIVKPGDFKHRCELYESRPDLWQSDMNWWRDRLRPDFSLLDEVIDRLLDGTFVEDERFGGYRRL